MLFCTSERTATLGSGQASLRVSLRTQGVPTGIWYTVAPLDRFSGSLCPLLYGTRGEDKEGGDQHALHWDQMQGGQRDEAPLGKKKIKAASG